MAYSHNISNQYTGIDDQSVCADEWHAQAITITGIARMSMAKTIFSRNNSEPPASATGCPKRSTTNRKPDLVSPHLHVGGPLLTPHACKPPPPGGGSVLTPRAAKPPLLRGGCSPFYQPPLSFLRRQESILLLTVDSFPHLPIYPSTHQPETWNLKPETCFYYAHNNLYSPVALMEDDGDVVERYEYDVYGKAYVYTDGDDDGVWFDDPDDTTYSASQLGNPIAFTGQRMDTLDSGDLQLMYYKNRYYCTDTGRFLLRDPIGYLGRMNLYQYVSSNILRYYDPYGYDRLDFIEWFEDQVFYGTPTYESWRKVCCKYKKTKLTEIAAIPIPNRIYRVRRRVYCGFAQSGTTPNLSILSL